MKKLFSCLIIFSCFLLIGCMNKGEKGILNDLEKKIDVDGYFVSGELEIINNDDSYLYDVEVSFEKENNFRVSLKNKVNNHEQIILKNTDGVYV